MDQTPFDSQHPPNETDRTLDLYLASLSRFEPGPGFADRVMAQVAVRPALAVRPWPARRARTLAALSGTAAVSSTALTAWVVANFDALAATTSSAVSFWAGAAWNALMTEVPSVAARLGESLAGAVATVGPVTAAGAVGCAVLSVPIGLFGLYLAARPPLNPRMVTHAAP